eukprot:1661012-Amphidinium_carterae.1
MDESELCRLEDEVGTSSLSATTEGLLPSLNVGAAAPLIPPSTAVSCHTVASGDTDNGTSDISTANAFAVVCTCHKVASGNTDIDFEPSTIVTHGACTVAGVCHMAAPGNIDIETTDASAGISCAAAGSCDAATFDTAIETTKATDICLGTSVAAADVCHAVASGNADIDLKSSDTSTCHASAVAADACHIVASRGLPSTRCEIVGLDLVDTLGALNPPYVGQDFTMRVDDTFLCVQVDEGHELFKAQFASSVPCCHMCSAQKCHGACSSMSNSELCGATLGWEDCHDPMTCVSALYDSGDFMCPVALDHAVQWEDCDNLTHRVQPEQVCAPVNYRVLSNMCWDDTDDLAHPWTNSWLNPPYYPWTGRSSAHLSPSSSVLLRTVVGDCGSFELMSRFTNWKKRTQRTHCKKGCFPSANQRTRWRRYRLACKESAKSANRRLRKPPTAKGHRLDVIEPASWIDECALLGVKVCTLSNEGGSASINFSHVSGDGNCFWRAVWAATAAARNWRRLKKIILRLHPHLHKFRPAGVLVGAPCYAAVANYLGCDLRVHLRSATVLFVPLGGKLRASIDLRVHDNHAQPACPASAASARRAVRSGTHLGEALSPCSVSIQESERLQSGVDMCGVPEALDSIDACVSSLVVGAKDPDRVHPCMVLKHKRLRRQRFQVHLDSDPSFAMFVDKDLPFDAARNRLALHMGLDPERACVHDDQGSLSFTCATTR